MAEVSMREGRGRENEAEGRGQERAGKMDADWL